MSVQVPCCCHSTGVRAPVRCRRRRRLLAYRPMSESVDLLAVVLPRPAAAEAIVRAWEAGEAVLPLDPDAPGPELARLLAAARPTHLLDAAGRSRLPGGRPAAPGTAAVVATSGTGGLPKAVELDAAAIGAAAGAVSSALDAGQGDRWLCCLPLHGVAGLAILARAYGLTETFGGVVHDGHPLEGVELRLDAGEILLRGPMLFRGYRDDPARTAAALRGGWLRTGDLGRLDPAPQRLVVLGRLDDLIVTGGVNVHPDEVEAVLAAHPGVAAVGVHGRPDPRWGQRVAAYVVPRDPAAPPTLAELRAFALERLAAAKAPRELVLVPALPRGPSGKLLRRLLPGAPAPLPEPAASPAT